MLDTDSRSSIVDNSANAHFWSIKEDFVPDTLEKLEILDTTGVATIGGGGFKPPLNRGC